MTRTFIIPLFLIAAQPVAAAGFQAPEGCTLFMTVQSRECRVSNYYKCSGDAPGDQWREDADQEGVFFKSRIDYETQWIESFETFPDTRQTLDPNPQDPASFSELLSTNSDTFAFGLSKDDGTQTRVEGFDKLTGRTFTIDGITLSETQYEFTEMTPDGTILRRARGNEYASPDMRMFFSGPSEWDLGDGNFLPSDGSPVEFIFPGEPGFAARQPIFDCDELMSEARPEPLPGGAFHTRHSDG